MVTIVIEAHGETQVKRELLKYGQRAINAEPLWESLYQQFLDWGEEAFDSEGARGGAPRWKELQPETLESKANAGLDPRILHASLRLRESLTQSGNPDQKKYITPQAMAFGSTLEYAPYHQFGAPAVNLPQRRPLYFTPQDRVEIVKRLQAWIEEGVVAG